MPIYKTEGIILRTRELGEADRIIVLLTKEHGRISVVAKGARKTKSKLAGKVQPLNYVQLLLYEGKTLDVINQVEVVDAFLGLRSDLPRMGFALSLAEIFEAMLEERQQNTAAFYLLLAGIHLLANTEDAEIATRAIELRLLSIMGYHPRLDVCAGCGRTLQEGAELWFSSETGGVICPACRDIRQEVIPIKPGTVLTMRQLLECDLRALNRLRVGPEIRRQLEESIHAFLSFHVDKKMKSWDFIHQLKELEREIDIQS